MAPTTTPEENKRIARRFIDEVSAKGNVDLIDELFAEDVIDHTPLGETRGREAIKELFENLNAAFSTHETTIENIVAEGDTVALRGPSTMTHEGEFMGIEPTGREVQIEGMNFLRIEDEKIVERWVQLDMLGMMQQLGVVDPPGDPSSQRTMETVTSTDGTEIAFERAGSGPPLVLVHGTGGDHTAWLPVLPSLEEHATVYAMDRRGVGGSGDADEYGMEREVEDVVAVVESIDEPVVLLGHSYGALISLEAALRTENLHKLILYEPWFAVGDHELVSDEVLMEMKALLADDENEQVLVLLLREVPNLSPDVIDAFRAAPNWQDIVATAPIVPRELHEQREYEFDATRFADLATPTVLLSGGESPPFFKDPTEAVDEALPNSRIVTLEEERHMANGLAPDLFSDEVLAFIDVSN